MKNILIPFLSLISLSAFSDSNLKLKNLELFQTLNIIQERYVETLSEEEFKNKVLSSLLSSLDNYSSYFNEKEYADLKNLSSGDFLGVGATLEKRKNSFVVSSIHFKSPAFLSGLKVNDSILRINDTQLLQNTPLSRLKSLFSGKPGDLLELVIQRDKNIFSLSIKIQHFVIENVFFKKIKDLNYIKIDSFTTNTHSKLKKILLSIGSFPTPSIILDLRENTGGSFTSAIKSADLFLEEKSIILSTKTRFGETIYTSKLPPSITSPKIVILVGPNTASSSEILTSALQENNIAWVIGHKTFGKGSVQSLFDLYYKDGILLTTGLYKTPNGNQIHGIGITPDIKIIDFLELEKNKDFDWDSNLMDPVLEQVIEIMPSLSIKK